MASRVKAAHPIKTGDRLEITQAALVRELLVVTLAARRGPAAEAARCYEETAASSERRATSRSSTPSRPRSRRVRGPVGQASAPAADEAAGGKNNRVESSHVWDKGADYASRARTERRRAPRTRDLFRKKNPVTSISRRASAVWHAGCFGYSSMMDRPRTDLDRRKRKRWLIVGAAIGGRVAAGLALATFEPMASARGCKDALRRCPSRVATCCDVCVEPEHWCRATSAGSPRPLRVVSSACWCARCRSHADTVLGRAVQSRAAAVLAEEPASRATRCALSSVLARAAREPGLDQREHAWAVSARAEPFPAKSNRRCRRKREARLAGQHAIPNCRSHGRGSPRSNSRCASKSTGAARQTAVIGEPQLTGAEGARGTAGQAAHSTTQADYAASPPRDRAGDRSCGTGGPIWRSLSSCATRAASAP